ncbi:hypothetical protein [Accumulibacter sp.]|uniref:nSTAND1 domain-containing NTPase n=1 Tax=Accumulibacter sp. TaxID=2053492 RepID=UPI00260E85FA|nr:hypothetical protein [Accumulibacter sp.]
MTIPEINPSTQAVATDVAPSAAAPAGIALDSQAPWPGLAAYDESSSDFFFGRRDESAELLRMVRQAPLTVVYGKSGLGKTSLLQAGLYPLLRIEHFLPVHLRLDFDAAAHLPAIQQVALKLDQALAAAGADFPARNVGEGLWCYLHRRQLEIWSRDNYPLTPVLVFDQFEEIFSRGQGDAERLRSTLDALADLIENRIPAELTVGEQGRRTLSGLDLQSQRYRIVLAFREDFLADVQGWKGQVPSLLRNRLRLLPMSRTQAVEVVDRAGAAVIAPGVAERVVDFVGNLDLSTAGALPVVEPVLLSLCCYQLNQRRASGARIDLELLNQAGQDILEDFYDEALAGMPEGVARFIETHLIQGDRYRGSYPVDQALQDGFLTRAQLSLLADKHRLLRVDQQLGTNRIELIHDRLVGVVRAARDARLRREELQRLHAREEVERQEAARREAIEREQRIAAEKLAEEQRARANAEIEARRLAERSRARLARMSRVLVLLLIAAVASAGWALWSADKAASERNRANQESRRATGLRLGAEAQAMLAGTRAGGAVFGVLKLLAAHRIVVDIETEGTMLGQLLAFGDLERIIEADSQVNAVAFSPDGSRIVSGGGDGSVRLWDTNSGQPIGQPFRGHQGRVDSVAFNRAGTRIVSGSQDRTVRLWDAQTGGPLGEPMLGHEDWVSSVAFNHDGRRIVSASVDGTLRLWDAETGQPIGRPMTGHADIWVTSAAFDQRGQRIVSGGVDGTIRLWDATTLRPIGAPMSGHQDSVLGVAFSGDGSRVVSASEDGTLRLWDADTGRPVGEPMTGHERGVRSVAFDSQDARIVSGSSDRTLRLWDARTGQAIGAPLRGHLGQVRGVAFSSDGKRVVSASDDGSLRLWSARAAPADYALAIVEQKDSVYSLAVDRNATRIVSGSAGGTLGLWDARTGEALGGPMEGHEDSIAAVAFDWQGERIVSASADRTLRLWDARSGRPIGAPLSGHRDAVRCAAFDRQGRRVVSGSEDGSLRLWEASTGQALGEPLVGHASWVTSVAFDGDGRRLVSGGRDGALRLWDAASGQPIGAPIIGHEDLVTSVAFDESGTRIVSGSTDGTLRLWDATTGRPIGGAMRGHEGSVRSVAFSADGSFIVSGSGDRTLRLWDAKTGQAIGGPLSGHQAAVLSVGIDRNGSHIVSASGGETLRLWPARGVWPAELCARVSRNMSRREWRESVPADIPYVCQCPGLPIPADGPTLAAEVCPPGN